MPLGRQAEGRQVGSGTPQEIIHAVQAEVRKEVSIPFIGSGTPQETPFSPQSWRGFEGCLAPGSKKMADPVEIISRDRGTEYIKGATEGAPDAIQVADRWHLLKNLREALQRLLQGKPDCLKAAAGSNQDEQSAAENKETIDVESSITPTTTMTTGEQQDHQQSSDEPEKPTEAEKDQLAKHAKRIQRFKMLNVKCMDAPSSIYFARKCFLIQ
ncbi:transposase [bacterium]|nr:transposase [bacterium]